MGFNQHAIHVFQLKSYFVETTMGFLFETLRGSVYGHHFVLFVLAILVHASDTEGQAVVRAIKSNDIVMLKAPLRGLRLVDGIDGIDRVFDFFVEAVHEFGELGDLEHAKPFRLILGILIQFRRRRGKEVFGWRFRGLLLLELTLLSAM